MRKALLVLVLAACSSDPSLPTGDTSRREAAYDLGALWCDNELACGRETVDTWGGCIEAFVGNVCTIDYDCDASLEDPQGTIDSYNCYLSLRNYACGEEPVCTWTI